MNQNGKCIVKWGMFEIGYKYSRLYDLNKYTKNLYGMFETDFVY